MNVGTAIDKDPATFRNLKRVVIMGGSIKRGYGEPRFGPSQPAQPEWNILNDISFRPETLRRGSALFVMPLDATN